MTIASPSTSSESSALKLSTPNRFHQFRALP
jgi:hypothetical protein